MGFGVLSGLIAVWCLEWKTVLIREEVRENIVSPLSSLPVLPVFSPSLSLVPIFSFPFFSFFPLFSLPSPTLYMSTQNDGGPARLISWQRDGRTQRDRERREGMWRGRPADFSNTGYHGAGLASPGCIKAFRCQSRGNTSSQMSQEYRGIRDIS